jgi:hypothetical protein
MVTQSLEEMYVLLGLLYNLGPGVFDVTVLNVKQALPNPFVERIRVFGCWDVEEFPHVLYRPDGTHNTRSTRPKHLQKLQRQVY